MQPDAAPGFGWPSDRMWINPSPNAPNLNMARCYAGTVMLEGATLSEGRGTTRPLELFGAPDIDARAVIARDARSGAAVAGRLHAARRQFRADLPQACRAIVQRRAYPCRGRRLRPPGVQAVAGAGARLQGHPQPVPRLRSVARFPVRICVREAADRRHQWRAGLARMGRRCRGEARRSRRAGRARRSGLGRGAAAVPALL